MSLTRILEKKFLGKNGTVLAFLQVKTGSPDMNNSQGRYLEKNNKDFLKILGRQTHG